MISTSVMITTGVVLLTVIAIAYGGTFMLRVLSGRQGANALQKSFFRAGHAHAGVLVLLGLVVTLLMEAARMGMWGEIVGMAVLACAILIPAGFFFSVVGHDPHPPNRWQALIWVGFTLLTVSMLVGGVMLIVKGSGI